ncbi:hypothetical protein R3P38DRAFT_3185222 [Favolaschia claudopus]|uniref:Uncharacterized protein n=1 Tax=Favolaschia claudopus TaxID=2862362 RepID=A0AAW0C779_9AGAR
MQKHLFALWLVEPMYFDETKEEKAVRKAKKDERAKNKRKAEEELAQPAPKKRRSDGTSNGVGSSPSRTSRHGLSPLRHVLTIHLPPTPPLLLRLSSVRLNPVNPRHLAPV